MDRKRPQIVLGRDASCDVVVDEPSVSSRHARLAWTREGLVVEDLGSTNGTFAFGQRVARAVLRRGDDVSLGDAPLPWGDPRLQAFLRLGERSGTLMGRALVARRFTCGACGVTAVLPAGYRGGPVACPRCHAELAPRATQRRPARGLTAGLAVFAAVLGGAVALLVLRGGFERVAFLGGRGGGAPDQVPPRSDEEAYIRAHRAPGIVAAVDATDPTTRDTAVRIASGHEGPYHVEQVAVLWTFVRGRWRYVNDPRGSEYFARASATIANSYAGDCDDFAITMAALVTAIGGEARVVLMDGPGGGHAYAEACVRQEPGDVATRLARHYKKAWDRYLGRQRVTQIHYRQSEACPVWLNLDWNAKVPGGEYAEESWSVAVTIDGRTETLTPAGSAGAAAAGAGGAGGGAPSRVRAAALPPVP